MTSSLSLSLKTAAGESLELEVDRDSSVLKLKEQVAEQWNMPSICQKLTLQGPIVPKVLAVRSASASECLSKAKALIDAEFCFEGRLNLKYIQELKCVTYGKKDGFWQDMLEVNKALMHLLAGSCESLELDSEGRPKDLSWNGFWKMATQRSFKDGMIDFCTKIGSDLSAVPKQNFESALKIQEELGDAFSVDFMSKRSCVAAAFVEWMVNVLQYYVDSSTEGSSEEAIELRDAEVWSQFCDEDVSALSLTVIGADSRAMSKQDQAVAVFKAWDVNGDGTMSEDELKSALLELGMSEKEIAMAFQDADANKDGSVDYEEFIAWVYKDSNEARGLKARAKVISENKRLKSQAILDAFEEAGQMVSTIKQKDINELKSLAKPAPTVQAVLGAVALLLRQPNCGQIAEKQSWKEVQKMFDSRFLHKLCNFDPTSVDTYTLSRMLNTYTSREDFDPEIVSSKSKLKSQACVGICKWVLAVEAFAKEHEAHK